MSSPVSHGFRHLRRPSAGPGEPGAAGSVRNPRLPGAVGPPGTPHTPLPEWTFSIRQGGGALKSWTWDEFQALQA